MNDGRVWHLSEISPESEPLDYTPATSMPVPPDARTRIREHLDQGTLPRKPPAKMFAGRGTGRICAGCDQPITQDDVEYEWEVDGSVRLHRECAGILEEEQNREPS